VYDGEKSMTRLVLLQDDGRRKRCGRRRGAALNAGFTMIELLVVVSILALVMGALGACLASGLRVWESAARFNAVESEALIGLEMMEKDVVNSFVFHGIAFDGRSEQLAFPLLVSQLPDPERSTACPRIGTVRYSFNERKKRFFRKKWVYPSEEPEGMETVVENVERVELRYLSLPSNGDGAAGNWKDSWESTTNLPDGVSIDMVFDDEGREMRFRRLVMLPHSR
jgi:prepilin-type N-terminal cleavage/methylation domain-containing protein